MPILVKLIIKKLYQARYALLMTFLSLGVCVGVTKYSSEFEALPISIQLTLTIASFATLLMLGYRFISTYNARQIPNDGNPFSKFSDPDTQARMIADLIPDDKSNKLWADNINKL